MSRRIAVVVMTLAIEGSLIRIITTNCMKLAKPNTVRDRKIR